MIMRKKLSISMIICLALTGIVWGQRSAKVYDARTDQMEILTPLPGKDPQDQWSKGLRCKTREEIHLPDPMPG